MARKTISAVLVITMTASPVLGAATPRIPGFSRQVAPASLPVQVTAPLPKTLPDVKQVIQGADVTVNDAVMDIKQNLERSIIEFGSFDIGSDAAVKVAQQKSWAALFRVYGADPARIFGRFSADGKIYLINRNGIVFGNGSQINLHSLVASSLNITNEDFLNAVLRFRDDNYPVAAGATPGPVSNSGEIATDELGSVFLLGPTVENAGRITSPAGQIGLAAGEDVQFSLDSKGKRQYYIDILATPGTATNHKQGEISGKFTLDGLTGKISGSPATIGMFGKLVNQNGIIRSISTINKSGVIELRGAGGVTTGPGSVTAVTPSPSGDTMIEPDTRTYGTVELTGLYPKNPLNLSEGYLPAAAIEHGGAIIAPGGHVTIGDAEKVVVKAGAVVDVSGVRVTKAAEANQIEVTLNSENLRDEHLQKKGMLLGEKIKIDAHQGSSIGAVDGYLTTRAKTAEEQYLKGGEVSISAELGAVTVEKGASLLFAGGNTHYDRGSYETTVLYSGGKAYDIAKAPKELVYDRIGSRVLDHPAHDEGADAGKLSMVSASIDLRGTLDGSVTKGMFQNLNSEPADALGRQTKRGWKEPRGGVLTLGLVYQPNNSAEVLDAKLGNVVITAGEGPLAESLATERFPKLPTSYIQDDVITSAKLGELSIYTNGLVKTEAGSLTTINPGGTLRAYGRRIEHDGGIESRSGTVDFTTHGNITSLDPAIPVDSGIFLGKGSRISTAGEVIDSRSMSAAHLTGGKISLRDITYQGKLIASQGSTLDVSGGYQLDQLKKKRLGGGNSGSITLAGYTLLAGGEMTGLALLGKKGGELHLYAGNVVLGGASPVFPSSPAADAATPAGMGGTLAFDLAQAEKGGFSTLEVKSEKDLTLAEGTVLAGSRRRLSPSPASSFLESPENPAGSSVIKLNAGAGLEVKDVNQTGTSALGALTIPAGTEVRALPGGEISLSANGAVTIAGSLAAPAGTVNVATGAATDASRIIVKESARISAAGYTLPEASPLSRSVPLGYSAFDGGAVSFSGYDISLEPGAVVDVSGSGPVTGYLRHSTGSILSREVAGAAGSLSLTFVNSLRLDADLRGDVRQDHLKKGRITLLKNSELEDFTLAAADLLKIRSGGFDSYSLGSRKKLVFSGSVDFTAGRAITLDAPSIEGAGDDTLRFSAPYLRLANSTTTYLEGREAAAGNATLTLAGDWLDLEGGVYLSGFRETRGEAVRDIRVQDRLYKDSSQKDKWEGLLRVPGNLTLQAERIYPAMGLADPANPLSGSGPSDFTFKAGGDITTLPGITTGNTSPYSAAGRLVLDADGNIEHRGTLAAPMGSIELKGGAASRVYLAEGSQLLAGGGGMVNIGAVDGLSWALKDKKSATLTDITKSPERAVSVKGDQVIIRDGAILDVSGGGTLYGYLYQPGLEGSANPLDKKGRFVILPGNPVNQPGNAVYLEGAPGVPAGVYSLLPAQYAFLPGAIIVTNLDKALAPGNSYRTKEGYQVVPGYDTFQETGIRPSLMKAYEIRPARDVLKEGNFTVGTLTAGNAGSLSVVGNTTILGGTIAAAPLAGYEGGKMTLAGKNIGVTSETVTLPEGFSFATPVPESMLDRLTVSSAFFGDRGLREIHLGDAATTDSLTIASGGRLEAPTVTLTAKNSITLENDVQVKGIDGKGTGTATLTSTDGNVVIGGGSLVKTDGVLSIDAAGLDLKGSIDAENGTLNLIGKEIVLARDDAPKSEGIFLSQSQWDSLATADEINLRSRNSLTFAGDFALRGAEKVVGSDGKETVTFAPVKELTLDAGRIAAVSIDGSDPKVTVEARKLTLKNSGTKVDNATAAETAAILFNAETMDMKGGEVRLDGFRSATLGLAAVTDPAASAMTRTGTGDLTLHGAGALRTDGDLTLVSARLTTSYLRDAANHYQTPDYTVEGGGKVSILASRGAAGTAGAPGGMLSISGREIEQSGVIDVSAGMVSLKATGPAEAGGVTLRGGAAIKTLGAEDAPGGRVTLEANAGRVVVESGATIDVSAGAQGDAGNIALLAGSGGVALNGTILGKAGSGVGGSFAIDTNRLDSLAPLNDKLVSGGFDNALDIRTRTGDLTVSAGQKVAARSVTMAADGGAFAVLGTIDASGATGGTVELSALNDVTVRAGGMVKSTGSDGGQVTLTSAQGFAGLDQGGTIDVSGTDKGGTVKVTASRTAAGNDVKTHLSGVVKGVDRVDVVAMKVTEYAGTKSIKTADKTAWLNDASTFMTNNGAAIGSRLAGELAGGVDAGRIHVRPGIEIRAQNITVDDVIDLGRVRYSGEAGVLNLRSAGNLTVNKNLFDRPTSSLSGLKSITALPSWDLGLVAGADFTAAKPYAVKRGLAGTSGKLSLANATWVYSESGDIRFASANDTAIGGGGMPGYMIDAKQLYNLATYMGTIRGEVGGSLQLKGGAIQSAVGDIRLAIGKNLDLGGTDMGTVRTTGEALGAVNKYDNYGGGGSISLDVAGNVAGNVYDFKPGGKAANGWDFTSGTQIPKPWAPSYQGSQATKGIATMAGGDLSIRTGGDFTAQAGVFGNGDLTVRAGGDVEGRFLIRDGTGILQALGNFAPRDPAEGGKQVIEMFDAPVRVTAQGDLLIGTITNPTIANSNSDITAKWNLTYGPKSAISLTSRNGSVAVTGENAFVTSQEVARLLPPSVEISAAGDVTLANAFVMAPAANRTLRILAGGDIIGSSKSSDNRAELQIPDVNPGDFAGRYKPNIELSATDVFKILTGKGGNPLATYQTPGGSPVEIRAGIGASPGSGGSLENFRLYLTKKAIIEANGDIRNIYYDGRNMNPEDTTVIRAGEAIIFNSLRQGVGADVTNNTGIIHGGPGNLLVQAGGRIDLGTTQGIQAVGNKFNPALPETGSSITVAAGFPSLEVSKAANRIPGEQYLDTGSVQDFFTRLMAPTIEYINRNAGGDGEGAKKVVADTRTGIIYPFTQQLYDPNAGKGLISSADINMTSSEISSTAGGGINIIANGAINVGKTALGSASKGNTGIYTSAGGGINIFAHGDVNVNESRIMTFRGGDIYTWSDTGNVNAGRGSRTAISENPSKVVEIRDGAGKVIGYKNITTPPNLGSGYRAVTYDPDGPEGPMKAPEAGGVTIVAPAGYIDAGEAGISGNKVSLGAQAILNSKNIRSFLPSIGLPKPEPALNLSALAGAGSLTDNSKMVETAALAGAKSEEKSVADKVDRLMSGWLDVKVVSFDSVEEKEKDNNKQ